jgi:hypothetical protein
LSLRQFFICNELFPRSRQSPHHILLDAFHFFYFLFTVFWRNLRISYASSGKHSFGIVVVSGRGLVKICSFVPFRTPCLLDLMLLLTNFCEHLVDYLVWFKAFNFGNCFSRNGFFLLFDSLLSLPYHFYFLPHYEILFVFGNTLTHHLLSEYL